MAGLSRLVLRHKLVVTVFWLAVLAVGMVASARLSGRLSAQFALPARPGLRVPAPPPAGPAPAVPAATPAGPGE